jgi:hypothetical protein
MTYEILQFDGRDDAIKCLLCGSVSYNANDVRERYCGRCHAFHADLESMEAGAFTARREGAER